MITSGRVEDWSVEDLLQMIRITGKTTSIEIDGDSRRGVLYFRGGFLVGIDIFPDAPVMDDPKERIVESMYLISALRSGTFQMGTRDVPAEGPKYDVLELIRAITDDKKREQTLDSIGVGRDTILRLTEEPQAPVILDIETWQMLAEMIPGITLGQLERGSGRKVAVNRILGLYRAGVLTVGGVPVKSNDDPSAPADQEDASAAEATEDVAEDEPDDVEVRFDADDTEELDQENAAATGLLVKLSSRFNSRPTD